MLVFFQCSHLITSDSDLLCCFSKMYYIYMSNTAKVLSEAGTGYPSRSAGLSQVFFWMCVGGRERLLIILAFCVVLCLYLLFVFALCLVCPILPVSLDCPFLIASSFFSNVYLYIPLITPDGELCS
jgi:hypothetical protein